MSGSTYNWSGFTLPDGQDPLGVWDLAPRKASAPQTANAPRTADAPEGAAAYVADTPVDGIVWRVSHSVASREALRVVRGQLATVDRRLEELDRLAQHLGALSPVTSYGEAVLRHDSELLAEVAALTGPVTAFSGEAQQVTTYGWLPARVGQIEATSVLLAQLRQLVQHWARIETRIDEKLIAVTTVDWTGDYETAWLVGLTSLDMALHLDDVKLALASRRALLRLISVVTTGALDLALKASVPGGQILLIPAVYKYVRDVLAEFEHLPDGVLTG